MDVSGLDYAINHYSRKNVNAATAQNLKNGKMYLMEVPFSKPGPYQIQVRVHYSAISAGTEARSAKDARASYIGKAKSRPVEVKK